MKKKARLSVLVLAFLLSGSAAADEPEAAADTTDAGEAKPVLKLRPIRVVIYDLQASGVDERMLGLVGESLLAEIRKLQKVAAMGMAEISALLSVEEQKQLLGCDDGACLAEVAGALGSDDLIVGSLGQVGSKTVLSLKRLDMRTTNLRQSTTKTMEGAEEGEIGEALLAAIGPSVETLFPEYPLRPGLERGVSPEVANRLDPPPLPTWIFWATAGTAAATGLLAGGMKVLHHQEVAAYNHEVRLSSAERPVSAAELNEIVDRADSARNAAIGLAATAGALALAAGIEALFTDWWGYGDEPVGSGVTAAAAPLMDGQARGGLVTLGVRR